MGDTHTPTHTSSYRTHQYNKTHQLIYNSFDCPTPHPHPDPSCEQFCVIMKIHTCVFLKSVIAQRCFPSFLLWPGSQGCIWRTITRLTAGAPLACEGKWAGGLVSSLSWNHTAICWTYSVSDWGQREGCGLLVHFDDSILGFGWTEGQYAQLEIFFLVFVLWERLHGSLWLLDIKLNKERRMILKKDMVNKVTCLHTDVAAFTHLHYTSYENRLIILLDNCNFCQVQYRHQWDYGCQQLTGFSLQFSLGTGCPYLYQFNTIMRHRPVSPSLETMNKQPGEVKSDWDIHH